MYRSARTFANCTKRRKRLARDARTVAALFDPTRLTTGRELRSMSQVELARAAAGLTAASVSQFENGHSRPSAATLERLAGALGLPLEFFARRHRPAAAVVPDAYFRSLRSTSAADRRRARALASLVHEFTLELEDHVTLPELDLPHMAVPRDEDAIEDFACSIRDEMSLPEGPVENVVQALERHGIVTVRFRVEAVKVDAFSVPYPDRPVVVLGADKGLRDRSRFDAAHELGHLLMHQEGQAGTRVAEDQAHLFAAAFLMPRADIEHLLPSRPDWRVLLELKSTWHVSLGALLRRAKSLGRMSPQAYTQAMKAMSVRGWRKTEPGHLGAPEVPLLLPAAVRAAQKTGATLDSLAEQAGMPLAELRMILGPSLDPRPRVVI